MKLSVDKKIVSRNLNELIRRSGKSRKEICEEMGVTYSTFTEWANGRKYPRPEGIEAIAKYFGIKKSELIDANKEEYAEANKKTFGANLNELVKASGKSRKEVCEETGIGYSTFTEWASGRSYPRIDKIELLARYFNVDKSRLIESLPINEASSESETDKKIVSRNINRLIQKSGKTRKEICEELGISYSTFTDWANGSNYPRPEGLEMLARYFGCDKSDLIEEREPSYQRLSPQEVGDIIRRRREAMGLTPADISARVGLTQAELADWESGKTADKSVSLAKRLADVLGLAFGTIIGVQSTEKKRYWKGFFQRLEEAFSGIVFTDAEIDLIIAYGKFLESQRKK